MNPLAVDAARCVGHGRCYELAPSLFEEDEYGYSHALNDAVDGADVELARQAALACPEDAVVLGSPEV